MCGAHAYRANSLSMQSFNNEEHLLDMLFTVKEIEIAIECIPISLGIGRTAVKSHL